MQTQQKYYSPEEYLALEEAAEYKNEYIDGQIVPMASESTNHNHLAGNFATKLKLALKELDYEVFIFRVRLGIPKRSIYTYPDVMVVDGELEYFKDRNTITNPKIIVEVLSNSTEGYDRIDKFAAYRTIPSFAEYLLFDQTKTYV